MIVQNLTWFGRGLLVEVAVTVVMAMAVAEVRLNS
jgi:hypothetical protein